MAVYSVDLDLLDSQIAAMVAFEASIQERLSELEQEIESLHGAWTGLAAEAQRRAHDSWVQGARDMHAALADLRAAARVAHANYSNAASSNVSMWNQVG